MALKIPAALLDQLRQHSERTYPYECCGVLVGDFDNSGGKMVMAVFPCGNTRTDSPRNRFRIDPMELVRVQREAMLAGCDIVGFYHSHPDRPAHWSAIDLAEAHWPLCSYVITGVEKGRAMFTNSFQLQDRDEAKHFAEEAIEVNHLHTRSKDRTIQRGTMMPNEISISPSLYPCAGISSPKTANSAHSSAYASITKTIAT